MNGRIHDPPLLRLLARRMSTRKRKATLSADINKMWSPSSSSRRKKTGGHSSSPSNARRNIKGGSWSEDRASELFDELVDEDSPDAADMEGEIIISFIIMPFIIIDLSSFD